MISNEKVSLPLHYEKHVNPSTNEKTCEPIENGKVARWEIMNQYIFSEFLNGRAGYVIDDMTEFKTLMSVIKYTNISVFNGNFKDDLSDLYEDVRSLMEDGRMSLVMYAVPMDYPGTYSVDSEFICSVSEILGADKLSSIKRLEYNIVKNTNSCALERLPWCWSMHRAEGCNGMFAIIPDIDNPGHHHPAFDVYCDTNAMFIIQYFGTTMVGSSFMSDIIDAHREYIETLTPLISNMYQWVGNVAILTEAENPDICSKIQAVIVWLLKSRTNRMLLHVTRQRTVNRLMEMVAFTNVVYTGLIPKLDTEGYLFIDTQGMVQISETQITGYAVVPQCDDAVDVIYNTFKQYCITPGGVNMVGACNYPFLNNVPSIFWNGRQYND